MKLIRFVFNHNPPTEAFKIITNEKESIIFGGHAVFYTLEELLNVCNGGYNILSSGTDTDYTVLNEFKHPKDLIEIYPEYLI